jgi:hypothetical protein
LLYANKAFGQFKKVFLKMSFVFKKPVPYWFKTLLGILEEFRKWFELF